MLYFSARGPGQNEQEEKEKARLETE